MVEIYNISTCLLNHYERFTVESKIWIYLSNTNGGQVLSDIVIHTLYCIMSKGNETWWSSSSHGFFPRPQNVFLWHGLLREHPLQALLFEISTGALNLSSWTMRRALAELFGKTTTEFNVWFYNGRGAINSSTKNGLRRASLESNYSSSSPQMTNLPLCSF